MVVLMDVFALVTDQRPFAVLPALRNHFHWPISLIKYIIQRPNRFEADIIVFVVVDVFFLSITFLFWSDNRSGIMVIIRLSASLHVNLN